MARTARRYPRDDEIYRMMEVGRKAGLDVGGYEVKPDGTIRIFEARTAPDGLDGLVERE